MSKKVQSICEGCGNEFRSRSIGNGAWTRTCSTKCGYKIRRVANKVEHVPWNCKWCGKESFTQPSQVQYRVYCSNTCREADPDYQSAKADRFKSERNPVWKGGVSRKVISSTGTHYFRKPVGREQAINAKRRAQKMQAAVKWRDEDKIRSIYKQCARISKDTGVENHVDHIVPLISDLVCGLHNEFNLQILTKFDNLSKGNKHSII